MPPCDRNADPDLTLVARGRADQPLGNDPEEGPGPTAALVFDADARLIYANDAFAKLVGVDPGSLIGSVPPFPWCLGKTSSGCRNRIRLLAGREARELGIESLSWSLSLQCGGCLRGSLGREEADRAFENELRDAVCLAVSDAGMMERIRAIFAEDAATPRPHLEAALRRIAREVEQLGFAVTLPARSREAAFEELRLLSPREWEVLRPFMEGRRVASIARLLHISPHTVRNHLQSIYAKFEVRSQAELIEKLRGDPPVPQRPQMAREGFPPSRSMACAGSRGRGERDTAIEPGSSRRRPRR